MAHPDINDPFFMKMRERIDRSAKAYEDWRSSARESGKFLIGDQWDKTVREMRRPGLQPCLVVNRLSQFVRLVANEISKSMPAMEVHPVDSKADIKTAKKIKGMIRHIEKVSDSTVAYGTATDNQVRTGIGYFGFKTRYARNDSFDQEICLRYFPNPLAVYPDPTAKEFDGSDSEFYFIVEKLSHDLYKERYPDSDVLGSGFRSSITDKNDVWIGDKEILVAEYWHIERSHRTLLQLKNGNTRFRDDLTKIDKVNPEDIPAMTAKSRKVEFRTVKQTLTNGYEKLEEKTWPGSWIPIFPVYGEVLYVDGKRVFRGLIEDAKEPQRVLNYVMSGAMEMVALAPKSPYVAAGKQIANYIDDWESAHIQNITVLRYDPVVVDDEGREVTVPAPQRQMFEPPIAALVQMIVLAEQSIKHAVGLHSPSIGQVDKQRSGKAIQSLQHQGQVGTYHFVLNFARSIRFAVKQLVGDGENPGLIQIIYSDPGRIMRVLGDDDSSSMMMMGNPATDEGKIPAGATEEDDWDGIYDLSAGLYDIVADIGQAFSTQRAEAFQMIGQILQSDPQLMRWIGDIFFKYGDFPGASELSERLKMFLPPEAKGEQPQIPPEVQQKIEELGQKFQEAQGTIQDLQMKLQAKSVERASIEKISSEDRESKEWIESLKAQLKIADLIIASAEKSEDRDKDQMIAALNAQRDIIVKHVEALKKPGTPSGSTTGGKNG